VGVLKFDDVDDFVKFAGPNAAVQAFPAGAKTMITVCRRETIGGWDAIFGFETVAVVSETSLEFANTNDHVLQDGLDDARLSGGTEVAAFQGLGSSKASGTQTPIFKSWRLSDMTVLADAAATSTTTNGANIGSGGYIQVGRWQASDPFDGWIALCAAFDYQMTEAQIDECFANKRTSDIVNNSGGPPIFLTELNTLTPVDLMGGCTGAVTVSGPTLDGAVDGNGWNFDGLGAPVVLGNRMRRWRY
jgi:hypothetical protein